MKIVTGYRGEPHITSNAAQAFNQAIFGSANYVLNIGNKFSAELTNVNTVTVSDGEGVIQGVHFRIEPGESETINITNGSAGSSRIDLICARYTKDSSTGIEDVSLVIIPGEPAESDPEVPEYNTGDILTGASPVDFPLYQVTLTGLTPTLSTLWDLAGKIKRVIINTESAHTINANSSTMLAIDVTERYGISPDDYMPLGLSTLLMSPSMGADVVLSGYSLDVGSNNHIYAIIALVNLTSASKSVGLTMTGSFWIK